MTRPAATVSVDLDPVDLHLVGYGYRSLPPDPLVYARALPRLLERFARHGVRATFFIVARDATAHAAELRAIRDAGHEVASHSLTHPLALASLPPELMRRELADSRVLLEQALGDRVVGYRSPNFDMSARSLGVLAECGYSYDASAYPTPMLLPARLVLALKSRDAGGVLRLKAWPFTWRRTPHVRAAAGRPLQEFPVSVTRFLRWPVYHTLRDRMSDAAFDRILAAFAGRGEPLSYPLHGVDALGLHEDGVDARFAPHPGMGTPLESKLALLDRTLAAIAARFEPRTFQDRLQPL